MCVCVCLSLSEVLLQCVLLQCVLLQCVLLQCVLLQCVIVTHKQSMSTCVILNQCCVYYGNVSVFRLCLLPQEPSVLVIQANEILTAIVQGMRKEEPRSLLY